MSSGGAAARQPVAALGIIALVYSNLLLALALADAAIATRVFIEWARSRRILLLFVLGAVLAVTLDVFLAAIGGRIGPGDRLRDLYALPLLLATFSLPLSLFTVATLCRRLDFPWARPDWSHGGLCLLATALLLFELRNLLGLRAIVPACWQDVVWYVRSVPAGLACAAAPGTPAATGILQWPIAAVLVLAGWLAFALGLWRHRQQRWPALALLGGLLLLLLPAALGPVPELLGESLCFAAIGLAVTRYAGVLRAPAPGHE